MLFFFTSLVFVSTASESCFASFSPPGSAGKRGVRDGRGRRVQAPVPGAQGQEDAPLHHLQDRREEEDGGGGAGGRARARLRRLRRQPPRQRVQVRHLRLRLRHRGELPEEQDLLHRLVRHVVPRRCLSVQSTLAFEVLATHGRSCMMCVNEGLLTRRA
jgi:hypothetical protein